jgi:hypothetical protein
MPHLLRRNGGCLSGDRLAALYDQDAGHASQKLALLSGTSAHDCPTGPVGAILIAVAERATAKSVPSTPIQRVWGPNSRAAAHGLGLAGCRQCLASTSEPTCGSTALSFAVIDQRSRSGLSALLKVMMPLASRSRWNV